MRNSKSATLRVTQRETAPTPTRLGAHWHNSDALDVLVWAPSADKLDLHFVDSDEYVALERSTGGYFAGRCQPHSGLSRYFYRIDGTTERPDPASRWQPDGVHGASAILPASFPWSDGHWRGIEIQEYIFYELHVGTYTPAGTFAALIERLPELRDLGITAVELMPVAEFPGARNWGYDGVYPFAAHHSYGGPVGLKQFVNSCHRLGLAVVLDVVYNHLGPEGNYLAEFGPYFTDRYHTPWGSALNFDGPYSDHVVRYFQENALQWLDEFHIDALRLDAVHGIVDRNAQPFLACLSKAVDDLAQARGRHIYLIAEGDANDFRVTQSRESGGYGMAAQWSDDFHHALHSLQTGDRSGYYEDFGRVSDLAKAFRAGFVYQGEYSPYRKQRHGSSAKTLRASGLVVCSQNHDQVGNRMLGERSASLIDFEALKLSAAVVLLSQFLPLLFMGEEFAEDHPFLYFASHIDPALSAAVREGRKKEFAAFGWREEPPDPQSEATFEASKVAGLGELNSLQQNLRHFYRQLIGLRKTVPALRDLHKEEVETMSSEEPRLLIVKRGTGDREVYGFFNFDDDPVPFPQILPRARWKCLLESASETWLGPGSAFSRTLELSDTQTLALSPHSASLFCRETL